MSVSNITFIRPMAYIREKEILRFANLKEIPYSGCNCPVWTDWNRNKIKHEIIWKNEQLIPKFTEKWDKWEVIAKKDSKIIFIEVKYRSSEAFWLPEEAITKYKLSKCKKTAEFFLAKNQYDFENIRFDTITILKQEKSYKITHYRNIEI